MVESKQETSLQNRDQNRLEDVHPSKSANDPRTSSLQVKISRRRTIEIQIEDRWKVMGIVYIDGDNRIKLDNWQQVK